MAKQTKNKIETASVKEVKETVNEEIVNKENDIKKETVSEENNELALMRAKMELLEKMLMNANFANKTIDNSNDEDVVLGCNMIYGVSLSSPNGDSKLSLTYRNENSTTAGEFKQILRSKSTKELLKNGIVYFVNEEDYEKFKINNFCSWLIRI